MQDGQTLEENYRYYYRYRWGWGLHVNVGMGLDEYQSTLYLKYLHYSKATPEGTTSPTTTDELNIRGFGTSLQDANAFFKVTRNRLEAVTESDLELTKVWRLKTVFGIRNEWTALNEHLWGNVLTPSPDSNNLRKLIESSRQWGIGPTLSFNPMLKLGYGFSAGPSAGISLLYTRLKYYEWDLGNTTRELFRQSCEELAPQYDMGFIVNWDYKYTPTEYVSLSLEYMADTMFSTFEANHSDVRKFSLYGLKSSLQYTF